MKKTGACIYALKYRSLISAAVFFLVASAVAAQLPTGTILGTVKDPSGAVIAGATVTVTDTDTNLSRSFVTKEDGAYRFPALAVGNYSIRVTKDGFQTVERTGLTLEVSQEAVVDTTLQVGSTTQTVTVTEQAPLVNTTSSTVGSLVNEEQVSDLPLNGRNYVSLTLLLPGVSQSEVIGNNVISANGMTGVIFSSNGAPQWSNLFLLDGAIMLNYNGVNNASIIGTTLGVDGIKEYKVVTSLFSADYGIVTGSQSTIVSKGGSNQFHGDVFEYLRNSALDARNYFDVVDTANQNGDGTDKSLAYPGHRLPPFRRNNFGGAFGGPIKKDKTFFWGVYEGLRQALGITADLTSIPKACFVNSTGVLQSKVPASIMNTTSNPYGLCVSGGAATLNVSPVVQGLADLYPVPNVTGRSFNYTFPYIQPASENYEQVRVDQNFSASDTAFVRYTQDVSDETQDPSFADWRSPFHSAGQFGTIAENHVFSSELLNTIRGSVSRTVTEFATKTVPEVTGANVILVPNSPCYAQCQPDDFGSLALGSGITGFAGTQANGIFNQNIFTLSDDIFWTKGKHSFKFGTLINHYQDNVHIDFYQQGTLSFSSLGNFFNADYSSLQLPTPGSNTVRNFTNDTFGFYVQDDYHVFSRVTLNLGLRYEFETVPVEVNPSLRYSIKNYLTDPTGTPGNLYANPSLHDFSPRLGFAWDITGKGTTSLRGGAGIFYDVANNGTPEINNALATPPLSSFQVLSNTATTPAIPLTIPLPIAGNQPITPRGPAYNANEPTMFEYNLIAEQRIPWDMALDIGYVGSRGINVMKLQEGNPTVPVGYQANGLPLYCFANSLGECPAGTANAPALHRPNPAFGQVDELEAVGNSYYNSLQVTLNKRISQGLQFQISYTYAQLLDEGESIAGGIPSGVEESPVDVNHIDRGPAAYNLTNNLRANMIYHLPNIQSDNFASKFEHGWWISTIVSAQSGYPYTVGLTGERALQNNYGMTDRPNLDPSYNRATLVTGNPAQWFNPTMFDLPPAGTLGNAGRGTIPGPDFQNVDFSLVKDTKVPFLGEAGSCEFRAEVFNLLNRANFGPPNTSIWSGTAATAPEGQIGTTAVPIAAGAGSITTTFNYSRQIQVALKILF